MHNSTTSMYPRDPQAIARQLNTKPVHASLQAANFALMARLAQRIVQSDFAPIPVGQPTLHRQAHILIIDDCSHLPPKCRPLNTFSILHLNCNSTVYFSYLLRQRQGTVAKARPVEGSKTG